VERDKQASAVQSRARIIEIIENNYTESA
jgi:hypothetical protein